jgi:hypothetical protein
MASLNDPSSQPKPKLVEDWYDGRGVIIAEAGPGTKVVMRISEPGVYYDAQMRPVSERDAARAGFNIGFFRAQKRAKEIQDLAKARADQILKTDAAEALKSPEQKQEERRQALRSKAARAVRTVQKQVQAAADKAVTRWLDQEPPAAC